MSDAVDLTTFREKVAARKAAQEAELKKIAPEHPSFDTDLIPETDQRSEEDAELDRIIDKIDVVDAYNKWCGKMRPVVRAGQTESIMISCPIPGHADKNPSAWINIDKQVWHCAKCEMGGDAMDLAAFHFGYPVPGYKDGARFHELRRDMAKSYGFTFHKLSDGKTYIGTPETETPDTIPAPVTPGVKPEDTPAENPVTPDDFAPSEEGEAKIIELFDELEDDEIIFPHQIGRAHV